MAKKAAPSPRSLALEGDLDVFSIHQQWERALPLLGQERGPVEVDLSGVGDLDLSGIQLLTALERDLQAKGTPLALTGTKADWAARFAPLGLAALFPGEDP